jgi:Zn-finger nucleic acid-binding protein
MPLINSPIDGAQIRQINRHGIEFDACPETGGVWLDRGEVEKLVALVKEEKRSEIGRHHNRRAGFNEGGYDVTANGWATSADRASLTFSTSNKPLYARRL